MSVPDLRLRRIDLLSSEFDGLVTLSDGLSDLAVRIGEKNDVPDLRFHALRVDGVKVQLFVHSETFEIERCMCRARLWNARLPAGA